MCVIKGVIIGQEDSVDSMLDFLLDYIPDISDDRQTLNNDLERVEIEGMCTDMKGTLLDTGILFKEAQKYDVDIEIVSFESGVIYTGFQEAGKTPIIDELEYVEPEEDNYDTEEDYYTALDNMYDYYFYL